ncbi:hypothetical protein PTI98_012300 [Pleurotus ostreatus]|nr:hypothetical protein PTI98_012300 [Pleurotus ostreatus]
MFDFKLQAEASSTGHSNASSIITAYGGLARSGAHPTATTPAPRRGPGEGARTEDGDDDEDERVEI